MLLSVLQLSLPVLQMVPLTQSNLDKLMRELSCDEIVFVPVTGHNYS